MGEYLKEELVKILRKTFFSITIDETTDVAVKGQLAVVVQYWDVETKSFVTRLFEFIEVESATANGLAASVLGLLKSNDIPYDR
jgi:hypothetical protein